jgi:hypothetical protein
VALNISEMTDKDVFMASVFYSLEASLGGAIYVVGNVSIKNCKFANNTGGEGNDVYVGASSTFYNDSSNIQNTCSLSVTPGQLKTLDVRMCIYVCINERIVNYKLLIIVIIIYRLDFSGDL